MKKIIGLLLALTMILATFALTACNKDPDPDPTPEKKEAVKLGVGSIIEISGTDADGETAGSADVTVTVAAVLVDKDGKVVACDIDAVEAAAKVNADGTVSVPEAIKTKRELGNDYGMSAIGKDEWYKQVDALESVIVGKKATEVAALIAADYKGTEDVQNAGCTIYVSAFVQAAVKAIENAKVEGAKEDNTLKVALNAVGSGLPADAEENGNITFAFNFAAAAKGSDGKVTAMFSDAAEVEFEVDAEGAVTAPGSAKTKGELGTDYGMSAIGKKEWNVQVAAFDSECVGKDANGIKALAASTGYGVESVLTAGCTIHISDIVKAASEAAE